MMCRQLGFSGGHLYHWFPRNNDSSQLMYEEPHCTGSAFLTDCPNWNSRQLGSGVCVLPVASFCECSSSLDVRSFHHNFPT
ncbi:SRCR domain-containing protein [Caerostris extrusa]|uniref:SRCR domain-containing protein n=1 Tax=Caerostris extrusa TaxID=172846 RepID=A0AAV4XX12_CAEEX|nr:SRCR domain-containing protein [Caerostris extrusa]